jgi:DNA methyltransferase 1-associated protein 1
LIERELTRKNIYLARKIELQSKSQRKRRCTSKSDDWNKMNENSRRNGKALLRTWAGIESGLPDIVEDDGGSLGITLDGKKKKKGVAMDIRHPWLL